ATSSKQMHPTRRYPPSTTRPPRCFRRTHCRDRTLQGIHSKEDCLVLREQMNPRQDAGDPWAALFPSLVCVTSTSISLDPSTRPAVLHSVRNPSFIRRRTSSIFPSSSKTPGRDATRNGPVSSRIRHSSEAAKPGIMTLLPWNDKSISLSETFTRYITSSLRSTIESPHS